MTGGQSVYLIFLVVSIHGRSQASMAAIFRQSVVYVFSNQANYIINIRIPVLETKNYFLQIIQAFINIILNYVNGVSAQ